MTYSQAINLAIDALRGRVRSLAIEANLHDLYHANHAAAITASRKRKEIQEAILILETGPDDRLLAAGDFSGYEICTCCGGLIPFAAYQTHILECQQAFLDQEFPA